MVTATIVLLAGLASRLGSRRLKKKEGWKLMFLSPFQSAKLQTSSASLLHLLDEKVLGLQRPCGVFREAAVSTMQSHRGVQQEPSGTEMWFPRENANGTVCAGKRERATSILLQSETACAVDLIAESTELSSKVFVLNRCLRSMRILKPRQRRLGV